MEQKVRECVKQIRKITDFEPQVALILGSGLGALADEIECVASIDYHEIPGFPVSTVALRFFLRPQSISLILRVFQNNH